MKRPAKKVPAPVVLSKKLKTLGIKMPSAEIIEHVARHPVLTRYVNKALAATASPKKRSATAKAMRTFGAPNIMYTGTGVPRSTYYYTFRGRTPLPSKPFNTAKNILLRNNNVLGPLENSRRMGVLSNLLLPAGPNTKGGVNPKFLNENLLNANPVKYAYVRKSKDGGPIKIRAFALLHNMGNDRYLELISAQKGLGGRLINQISNNARKNGKKAVTLSAVNSNALRQFYRARQFRFDPALLKHYANNGRNTKPNKSGKNMQYANGGSWLLPMRKNLI
jgi:hypothetical protein